MGLQKCFRLFGCFLFASLIGPDGCGLALLCRDAGLSLRALGGRCWPGLGVEVEKGTSVRPPAFSRGG